MRTLGEIIEAAKDGQKPDHDECYYAMLALAALNAFNGQDVLSLHPSSGKVFNADRLQRLSEEAFERNKRCHAADPKQYIGWDHDPANPEYQKFRKMSQRLFDKIEKQSDQS